jgi:acetoin utilization protein AcuC
VAEEKASIAFNIAGGLHHAHANQASGFCYLNDPVLAIYHFLDQGKKVMYLDIDAHHGDGVQWAFYDIPSVLTVSFHQDGGSLFPGSGSANETGRGKGAGYAVNVPMLPGTDDEVFLRGFEYLIPRLMDAFKPDVIVSQLGVDTFVEDPLASLELTTHGFCRVIGYLTEKAPAWVALGGGGYNLSNVARAWTLAWAIMNGVALPDELPEAMKRSPSMRFFGDQRLRDDERKGPPRMECRRHMEACLEYLKENVLSLIS